MAFVCWWMGRVRVRVTMMVTMEDKAFNCGKELEEDRNQGQYEYALTKSKGRKLSNGNLMLCLWLERDACFLKRG